MTKQTSLSRKLDYSVPPVDGDFYRVANLLNDAESAVVKRVRDFMEREIAPIIDVISQCKLVVTVELVIEPCDAVIIVFGL